MVSAKGYFADAKLWEELLGFFELFGNFSMIF